MMIPESISQLFQSPPKCIISINDSAASQDIVAQSDAFSSVLPAGSIRSTTIFPRSRLRGEDSILAHYYVTKKGQTPHPLTAPYVEELKKCSMVFNEDIPTY